MASSVGTLASPRLVACLALALAVAGTGCGGVLGGCTVESRALEYGARSASGALTGDGFLELSETRGAADGTFVIWHLRASPSPGTAISVSLRQGPPEAPGRLLYQFPVVNAVPASGVLTQVFVRTPYAGEVPFAELWDLVEREPVSFHAVLDGGRSLRVGPLVRIASSGWQDACS